MVQENRARPYGGPSTKHSILSLNQVGKLPICDARLYGAQCRRREIMSTLFERGHCALQVFSACGQNSRKDRILRLGEIGNSSQSLFFSDVGVKDVDNAFDIRDQSACL